MGNLCFIYKSSNCVNKLKRVKLLCVMLVLLKFIITLFLELIMRKKSFVSTC